MSTPTRVTIAEARLAPVPPGRASALLLSHGSLELRWYAPVATDTQTPHTRDELYIVASGHGVFQRESEHVPFGPGDALFVAAGEQHRFIEFSEDFAVWVMFYGQEGGECPK